MFKSGEKTNKQTNKQIVFSTFTHSTSSVMIALDIDRPDFITADMKNDTGMIILRFRDNFRDAFAATRQLIMLMIPKLNLEQ